MSRRNNYLTACELKALEQIWMAEVSGKLPFQSRAAIYRKLADDGLVLYSQEVLGGSLPVVISGWYLTHAGRLLYCMSC